MVITAVLDRFEGGQAVLLSSDAAMEISIPQDMVAGLYSTGEEIKLSIGSDGAVEDILK